ncbi:hypothetical protein [uncultured Psychroserpens sp.]|uniref:hypothetical protein n=1 Tax=uncultured Psychroserpens sp. TaxID=255436 RepID=UPI00261EFC67|nr:hypothetical protein [uncultured Psychroserpens sp.]
MKKITILALSVLMVNICAAQLSGGGSTSFSVNNDNPLAGAYLTGQGISPSYKNLGRLFGWNTIYNCYGNRGYGGSDLNPVIYNLDRSLNMRWRRAKIFINGQFNHFSARYNPISDDIEIKDNDKIFQLIKRNNVQITFLDSNETYIVKPYKNNLGQEVASYFLIDEDSKASGLLKKRVYSYVSTKTYKRNRNARTHKPIKFKMEDHYYIINDNKLVALSTNRKSIKRDFPEDAKLILTFIKEHKIRKNTRNNLKVLATYISSLETNTYDRTAVALHTF